MIKHITIALGAAALSFIPTLAHAQEVYPLPSPPPPPAVGVQAPAAPSVTDPGVTSLPATGSDSTIMLLQVGSLILVAGGAAVVATHRRRVSAVAPS
jgi:LPXTG-motif cell wall-anchored protein